MSNPAERAVEISSGGEHAFSADSLLAAQHSFDEAVRSSGELVTKHVLIAGQIIEIHFAGKAPLPTAARALEHAQIQPASPHLTIHVWDSVSTKSSVPEIPWYVTNRNTDGAIRVTSNDDACIAYQGNTGMLSLLDIKHRKGYYWCERPDRIPYYEVASPMSLLFHWWFNHAGFQMVHGAGIGMDGKGIVLAGRGGSGKSNTALAALETGMEYIGDDYCLIDNSPEPTIHNIYNSAKLFWEDVEKFPGLSKFRAAPIGTDDEKQLLFLKKDGTPLAKSLTLKAFFLARVSGRRETELHKASPAEMMKALAPSTLFQLPGARKSGFERMSALAKSLPSYRLELGTDRQHMIDTVAGFFETNR